MLTSRPMLSLLIVACLTALASSAAAETTIYDWTNPETPVVVRNASGLIFIGKDKRPIRAYRWKETNKGPQGQTVFFTDMDQDGSFEIVGAGKPTFVLQTNSDPLWQLEDGCDQVIVADFVADNKYDLMCQNGKEIKVYTHDGQFVWSLSLGRRIDECRAGDYNGDLKADLECQYRGMKKHALIESKGEIINPETDEQNISGEGIELDRAAPVDTAILDGKTYVDLNADGHDDEYLKADGEALVIGSKAADTAIGRVELDGKPLAALIKDVDADGNTEVVAVTEDTIYLIAADARDVQKFAASANKYKRKPVAQLDSVYANGFGENNDKAKAAVEAARDNLSKCYASRVKHSQYTGVGQLIMEVHAAASGKVEKVSRVHSEINDAKVENCVKKALKRVDLPKAADENAKINVIMKMTFADE